MLLNVSIICNSKKACSNYREILNVPSDVHGGTKSTKSSIKTAGRNDTEYLKSYDEIQALTSVFSSSRRTALSCWRWTEKDIMAVEISADTLLVTLVSFTIHKAVSLRFAFSIQYNSNICWNFAFTQIYRLVSSPATSQTVTMT